MVLRARLMKWCGTLQSQVSNSLLFIYFENETLNLHLIHPKHIVIVSIPAVRVVRACALSALLAVLTW